MHLPFSYGAAAPAKILVRAAEPEPRPRVFEGSHGRPKTTIQPNAAVGLEPSATRFPFSFIPKSEPKDSSDAWRDASRPTTRTTGKEEKKKGPGVNGCRARAKAGGSTWHVPQLKWRPPAMNHE